jgi:hypothetical protein
MQIRPGRIDLGKTTFHLVALGIAGKVCWGRRTPKAVMNGCQEMD